MATKMDSAERAFEAATLEPAAQPATPAAPAAAEAPRAAKASAPKNKTVKAKAKPVQKKAEKSAVKPAPKKPAAKTITPKIKAAPEPLAAATKGFQTMNETVKKFAEDAKVRAEALTAELQERSKEALTKSSKLAEEAVEFNKANVEALVEAGKIAAKNFETLGQEGVAFARKSFEETSAALKGYTAVKSPAEFFKLYAENSKKAFDSAAAQTSKTSELVVKMANDSFAPISNRLSVISSKMKAA
ncbi:phasin family protein [Sphingopyxis flava]|uniref:Phasin family protein n=1 Tax=Sphingopyxis flava TaxID=1507287 RepID=A0A1T5AMT2_9SPHN|nr:phasin family protein [Sphingopyxis flava]SKB36150.1 phasin family protein [Sphingopyxis flava]